MFKDSRGPLFNSRATVDSSQYNKITALLVKLLVQKSPVALRPKTIKGSVVDDVPKISPIANCHGRRWRNMTISSTCDRRGTELENSFVYCLLQIGAKKRRCLQVLFLKR